MDIINIVEVGLRANGFDGLVTPGICGCLIGDLSPGDCLNSSCEGGFKHTHSQKPDEWVVSTKRDAWTDEEIERCLANCG